MEKSDKKDEQYIIVENSLGMQFKIACANPDADCLKAVVDTFLKGPIPEEFYVNSAVKLAETCLRTISVRKTSKKIMDVFVFLSSEDFDIQTLENDLKLPKTRECCTSDGETLLLIDSDDSCDNSKNSFLNQTNMLLQKRKLSVYSKTTDELIKKVNENFHFFDLYDLIMIVIPFSASLDAAMDFFALSSRCVSPDKIFFICNPKNKKIKESIEDACRKALIKDAENWLSKHILENFEIIDSIDRTEIGFEAVFDCFRYEYSTDQTAVLISQHREELSELIACENVDQSCLLNLVQIRSMFENDICPFLIRTNIIATKYPFKASRLNSNTCQNGSGGYSVSCIAERMITMYKDSMSPNGTDAYNNWQAFINNPQTYTQVRTPLLFQERHGYLLRLIYNYLSNITHNNFSTTFINNKITFLTLKYAILDCMVWLSHCMASCQGVVNRRC